MERIDEYVICKEIVDACRKKSAITNCFFMAEQIKKLVRQKKLYIEENEGNIFIFEKEESFYRVYYFIKNIRCIPQIRIDSSAVIEFPYNGVITEQQNVHLEIIKKMGFKIARESARMSVKSCDVVIREMPFLRDIKIGYARMEEVSYIITLLNEVFDPMYSFLPTEEETKRLIMDKRVLICYHKGEMAGTINMDIYRNTAWIRQIAIVEKFRGRGIGWVLLNKYHELFKNEVKDFMHWVDISNKSAISMYQKAGYIFDGRRANEYSNTY